MTLFTIGYEQAKSAAVIDELKRAHVGLIVDTRAVAASRRPGFSKRQLAAGLDEAALGDGLRRARAGGDQGGEQNGGGNGSLGHLVSNVGQTFTSAEPASEEQARNRS